jgi:alkylation response protein AidB-like acyl-CoA dehydrogenase
VNAQALALGAVAGLPDGLRELRLRVRRFLEDEIAAGGFAPEADAWRSGVDPAFSGRLAGRAWVGMTIPAAYGGHGRTALDRYVVTEELLAAGAPVAAQRWSSWRTDDAGDRHAGLSQFIVDLPHPAVSIRPIITIDGAHHFNEVVFDDAVIPVAAAGHQLHGAIGFTTEHRLGACTRRLWAWREEHGNELHWQRRCADLARGSGDVWELVTGEPGSRPL